MKRWILVGAAAIVVIAAIAVIALVIAVSSGGRRRLDRECGGAFAEVSRHLLQKEPSATAAQRESKYQGEFAGKPFLDAALKVCVRDRWPYEVTRCIGRAKDEAEVLACTVGLSDEQQTRLIQAVPVKPIDILEAKRSAAASMAKILARTIFKQWARTHDEPCPKLDELVALAPSLARDPWGHPFRLRCGADLPAGVTDEVAISSDGPDGQPDTEDDARSW